MLHSKKLLITCLMDCVFSIARDINLLLFSSRIVGVLMKIQAIQFQCQTVMKGVQVTALSSVVLDPRTMAGWKFQMIMFQGPVLLRLAIRLVQVLV